MSRIESQKKMDSHCRKNWMAVLDVILDVILDAVLDVAGVWTLKLDGFILGCGSFADARSPTLW